MVLARLRGLFAAEAATQRFDRLDGRGVGDLEKAEKLRGMFSFYLNMSLGFSDRYLCGFWLVARGAAA